MRRIDAASALLVGTICVVLGCTAVLLRDGGRRSDLAGQIPPESKAVRTPYRMIVVFGPEDCEGRLNFIHLATQPRFRGTISVTGILVGSQADGARATQRLRARGLEVPVHVRRRGMRIAARLGYPSTPYLLIVDETGRLRFAMGAPGRPGEVEELERVMRLLALQSGDSHRA